MVFGIVAGVLTNGIQLRTTGTLVQVRWAIGITTRVLESELTTVNPRTAGHAFPE